jgi:hypothetical protein
MPMTRNQFISRLDRLEKQQQTGLQQITELKQAASTLLPGTRGASAANGAAIGGRARSSPRKRATASTG